MKRVPRPELALVLCAVTGCAEPVSPAPLVSETSQGLRLRGAQRATSYDHFVEMLAHENHVYIANTGYGLAAMHLESEGGLTTTYVGANPDVAPEEEWARCTTLALHAASDTLYCGADLPLGDPQLVLYDLSTPGEPVLRERVLVEPWELRDIEVVGDTLLLAAFGDGLWSAAIDPAGGLSTPVQEVSALSSESMRFIANMGTKVVLGVADLEGGKAQLRVLDPNDWSERGQLELDGPFLGLNPAEAGVPSLAVAQGSLGLTLIDLDGDTLSVREQLEVPGVVTHGLLSASEGLTIAVTLSGAFAFDEHEGSQRLFGFGPESAGAYERTGSMLHALLVDGELLTSDWTWVERWALDPKGEAAALDFPRGAYVSPGEDAHWRMRNPGAQDLRVEFWFRGQLLFEFLVPADSADTYTLEADVLAAHMPVDEISLPLGVRIHDPAVSRDGEPLAISSFTIAYPEPDAVTPPPLGQKLPPITLADVDGEIFELPPEQATRVVFYSPGCPLMWPELEDLSWLAYHGHDDLLGGQPVFVTNTEIGTSFGHSWAALGIGFGIFGSQAPPEVDAANEPRFGSDLFQAFVLYALPGDGLASDYELDAEGRVRSIERTYRGPWSLAVPWREN